MILARVDVISNLKTSLTFHETHFVPKCKESPFLFVTKILSGWLFKCSLFLHSNLSESLWQVVTDSGWFRLRQAPSPAVSLVPFHIHVMSLRVTPNSSSQFCWHYKLKIQFYDPLESVYSLFHTLLKTIFRCWNCSSGRGFSLSW